MLHVPPPIRPVNVMKEPIHTDVGPVIVAVGAVITGTVAVAVAVPQLLLTV
jgi:hypothetical protein